MANVDWVQTATGSIVLGIDSDNDSGTMEFRVEHDGGGAGNTLFKVQENGLVIVFGRITRAGVQQIENSGAGDIIDFVSAGGVKASITATGLGIFNQAGIRLPVVAVDPNGAVAGTAGDLVIYNNAGTYELKACTGGMAWQII